MEKKANAEEKEKEKKCQEADHALIQQPIPKEKAERIVRGQILYGFNNQQLSDHMSKMPGSQARH